MRPLALPTAAVLLAVLDIATASAVAAGISFNRDVRPILSDNCFACHGPAEDRGGDLRLDVRDDAVADRGGYAAIVPGKPAESEILRRILSSDPDAVMPPPRAKKHKLSEQQLAILERWIEEGAEYQGHWSFQPLASAEPPASSSGRARNEI
ncbi:MAG: hypothetical protein RLZZ111_70, partial [Planctomycetota bacterium]